VSGHWPGHFLVRAFLGRAFFSTCQAPNAHESMVESIKCLKPAQRQEADNILSLAGTISWAGLQQQTSHKMFRGQYCFKMSVLANQIKAVCIDTSLFLLSLSTPTELALDGKQIRCGTCRQALATPSRGRWYWVLQSTDACHSSYRIYRPPVSARVFRRLSASPCSTDSELPPPKKQTIELFDNKLLVGRNGIQTERLKQYASAFSFWSSLWAFPRRKTMHFSSRGARRSVMTSFALLRL
jgi:hypothetical protein